MVTKAFHQVRSFSLRGLRWFLPPTFSHWLSLSLQMKKTNVTNSKTFLLYLLLYRRFHSRLDSVACKYLGKRSHASPNRRIFYTPSHAFVTNVMDFAILLIHPDGPHSNGMFFWQTRKQNKNYDDWQDFPAVLLSAQLPVLLPAAKSVELLLRPCLCTVCFLLGRVWFATHRVEGFFFSVISGLKLVDPLRLPRSLIGLLEWVGTVRHTRQGGLMLWVVPR